MGKYRKEKRQVQSTHRQHPLNRDESAGLHKGIKDNFRSPILHAAVDLFQGIEFHVRAFVA